MGGETAGTFVSFVIPDELFIAGEAFRGVAGSRRHIKNLSISLVYLALPPYGLSLKSIFQDIIMKPNRSLHAFNQLGTL